MPKRAPVVSSGDVLHIDVSGKGRHVGIAIDVGPDGEAVFAVATSGVWRNEPIRRTVDFSAEPDRSWIRGWPRDNGALSHFYGGFIDVIPPERWLRAVGSVPRSAVEALLDLYLEWDAGKRGATIPPGPTSIPP